jgi:N-acetylneuraminic acid mutarotase
MNCNVKTFRKVFILVIAQIALIAAQTWTSHTPIPTPRWYPASVLLDGKIYVIGGQDSTYPYQSLNTVEVYDPVQDTWDSRAPMLTDRWGLMAAAVGGKIYAIGGRTGSASQGHTASNSVEEYDRLTDMWTSKTVMPTARGYGGCGVYHDTIFVFGGRLISAVGAVEKYYPPSDAWSADPQMPWGRYTFGIGLVDSKFYLIGGWGDNTVQEYDLNTRIWTTKTSMPTSRGGSGYDVIDGLIYVVGGRGGVGEEFECYDAAADSWTTLEPMPTAREGLVACGVGGDLYAITGSVPINQGGLPYLGENEKASGLTSVQESVDNRACWPIITITPNPGRERIFITYTMPQPDDAELAIFDCTGRQIKQLNAARQEADKQVFEWTCRDDQDRVVPAGVYFMQLKSGNYRKTSKVLITR